MTKHLVTGETYAWFGMQKPRAGEPTCTNAACSSARLYWQNGSEFYWDFGMLRLHLGDPSERCSAFRHSNTDFELVDAYCYWTVPLTICEFDCQEPVNSKMNSGLFLMEAHFTILFQTSCSPVRGISIKESSPRLQHPTNGGTFEIPQRPENFSRG